MAKTVFNQANKNSPHLETLTTFLPHKELMRLDLPTLGWPRVPMVRIPSSVIFCSAPENLTVLTSVI